MRQKTDKMNFKLHFACSKDDLRPSMTQVYVTKKNIVATDANILAVVPTEDVFDDPSIELLPEEGMYIDSNDWKKLVGAYQVIYNGEFVVAFFPRKSEAHVRPRTIEDVGNYPQWEQIVPDASKFDSVGRIGLIPKMLYNLHQALDVPTFKLEFIGDNKPVAVGMPDDKYSTSGNQYGIIMPLLIQDDKDEDLSGNGDEDQDVVDTLDQEVEVTDEVQAVINQ